ncbi:MAG: helix-turn-helix domain-containing protein [Bacteroidales bacterium]|nr:helix-turn-helix domain-containing protein [Bacteroidales bacterium]
MSVQEVMKERRKKLGITQQDLAEMAEVGISTIKQIESGKGNPSLGTVEKIMEVLGMEIKFEVRRTV